MNLEREKNDLELFGVLHSDFQQYTVSHLLASHSDTKLICKWEEKRREVTVLKGFDGMY